MNRLIPLIMTFVLAIAALAAASPAAFAQEPGTLVIGKHVCPPNLPGQQINPADCTEPAAGVEFFVANPGTDNVEFGATAGDGSVSFGLDRFAINPDGALVDVGELLASNPYGEVTGYIVSCTRNGEPLEFSYQSGEVQPGGATLGIQFTVFAGDQVACDWFNSHAGAEEPAPSPTPVPEEPAPSPTPVPEQEGEDDVDDDAGGTIAQLPSTGAGATTGGQIDGAFYVAAALLTLFGALALGIHRRAVA